MAYLDGLWGPAGQESWPWSLGVQRAVAACGRLLDGSRGPTRKIAPWKPGVLKAWSLRAWGETGSLDVAMMMRLRMRMLVNDDKDDDEKDVSHARAWGARRIRL